ncbi:MAG: Flp family type IVb pilin [Candidatus Binataceae bacterium]
MDFITKNFVKFSELRRRLVKGQTMTEYALIMAAIAVAVYATYQTMGNDIKSAVNSVDTSLAGS